jgi:hypothetical protein
MQRFETDSLYPYTIQPMTDVGRWELRHQETGARIQEGSWTDMEAMAKKFLDIKHGKDYPVRRFSVDGEEYSACATAGHNSTTVSIAGESYAIATGFNINRVLGQEEWQKLNLQTLVPTTS